MVEMDVQFPYDIDALVERGVRMGYLVDVILQPWAPGAQPIVRLPWSAGGRIKPYERVIL